MQIFPNYQQPIVEALAVLEDSGIDRFPVDLHVIQQQYRKLFQIRSYGSYMKDSGFSRKECYQFFESEDGAAVFDGCCKFIVYYNEKKRKQRIRFTIAHEVGHIMLDHHQEYGKSILNRDGISKQLYKRLENEANCFARNLLSPAYHAERLLDAHGITQVSNRSDGWVRTKETAITANLKVGIDAETLIENAFYMSNQAAKARVGLLHFDINKYSNNQIDWKTTAHIKQSAAWHCYHCGLERFPGAAHCSECGQTHFVYKVGNNQLTYRNAKLNTYNQFSICPVCGNREYSANAGFCKMCGALLSNPCTDDPTHLNHPEAKYCYQCGKPTFHETKANVKNNVTPTREGDLSMIYESDIKYDPETNKVTECPRCQNEIFSVKAQHCRICGLELVNRCIPDERDEYGNYTNAEPHDNPPDARFCEVCGEPTVYFQKHELFESYKDVLEKQNAFSDDPF